MENSDSGHKCWIQTLNHFSYINNCMEEGIKKQRLCLWMKQDTEAIGLVHTWLEENNPFNLDCDKQFLVSFSTRFTSNTDDVVDTKRAAEVGREMQINLEGKSLASTMQGTGPFIIQNFIIQNPKVNAHKLNYDKLFNQLIIISQRDMTVA